jgi:4-hydroxythreonine-4-phosphate dehydrogenase
VLRRPRLAVTLGDPRGIGPEVVTKALALGPLDAEVVVVGSGERGAVSSVAPEQAGRIAGQAVQEAARLALTGQVDAIVTGPVHKHALHLAGFRYPGLTEFLGHLAGDVDAVMMLATGRLRVVLVTTHIALKDVPAQVTADRVVRCGRVTERALREWWGIDTPRLAVCALNPHAGESGLFGDEDERVLGPAARTLGAAGPLPADTVFVRGLKGEFDAVLAPYHDVGMTAVKVAGFGTGVNVTLGLPFPRVAPDHGTAFDIAGKGVADPGSMRAALELGVALARRAAVARG